ncbi:MAG: NAD-dependent epimerase/dehydratase family protein [Alphaproteobacteria bacterium]|nr:NAD-dependent epimerase/dehydratase family protein [Alphaproteobacteria bacterium]
MSNRIFVAGATGAVGARLVPLLLAAGHRVTGTTRRPERAAALARAGAEPVVVDAFDRAALIQAVVAARPDVVIHQLTDLPPGLDPARMADALPRNARLRAEGTANLAAAAVAAGARRLVAQSIAWIYADGPAPHGEDDPLENPAEPARRVTIDGVKSLERITRATPGLVGIVLRYGRFYGPGTGVDAPAAAPTVHVDAAAQAALLAVAEADAGIFNIAEPNPVVSIARARDILGWDPGFRLSEGPR